MDSQPLIHEFKQALEQEDGNLLASTITPIPPAGDAGRLYSFHKASNFASIEGDIRYAVIYSNNIRLSKVEGNTFVDLLVVYWKAVEQLLAAGEAQNQHRQADWVKVYTAWKVVVNELIKGYNSNALAAWTIPCLYVAGKYLRIFAIKADEQVASTKGEVTFNAGFQDDVVGGVGKHQNLENAAQQLLRIFSLCIGDRAPEYESRKWAIIYTANLLYKTYFKLNNISLCRNVLKSLRAAQHDLPALNRYPKSHQVTFNYYTGVLHFLEENYPEAEKSLTEAWNLCHRDAHRNRELILTYLIPIHILTTTTLPSSSLLSHYPRLQSLFSPLTTAIKRGDLAAFDAALIAGEDEFVKRRIYLTLERGRDLAVRNLLRKVFVSGGFEPIKEGQSEADRVRRTRVPVREFEAAIRLGMGKEKGEVLEADEVECYIANMIYKGFMKGYISRNHGIVVLSKAGAFPGTGV